MTFKKFSAANTAAPETKQDDKSRQGRKPEQQAKPEQQSKPMTKPAAAPPKVEPAPKS